MMVDKIIHKLSQLLALLSGLALAIMMLHVTADVASKYLLNAPIPGTAEVVASYYMIAVVFLPLAWLEITNGSIVVELFYQMVSMRCQRVMLVLANLLSLIFYAVLSWLSWAPAVKAYRIGEIIEGAWKVTIWPTKFLLPIGLAVACLVLAIRLVQMFMGKFNPLLQMDSNQIEEV